MILHYIDVVDSMEERFSKFLNDDSDIIVKVLVTQVIQCTLDGFFPSFTI